MYFPYLRGRQFELIAIRELVEQSLIGDSVIPVIEPVKLSSTLLKTMRVKHQLGIVRNPKVGSIKRDLTDEKNVKKREQLYELLRDPNIVNFLYVDVDIATNYTSLARNGAEGATIATICNNQDAIPHFESLFTSAYPTLNFIPDESVFRRRLPKQIVLFKDRFPKKKRNVDYADLEDEPFSSDHLYYAKDGYVGFSDFSIIGDEYTETGFAPYAVAIHIVYFDTEKNLRIRHFVSETNDDITDPAGKFAEALKKLVEWNRIKRMDTFGIRKFEEMYRNGIYPGLGTVKKLSIMHHLELMNRYLDGVAVK